MRIPRSLTLPGAMPSAEPAAEGSASGEALFGSLKDAGDEETAPILLVDDDPDILETMKAVLETRPYRLVTARDGQQCPGPRPG